MFYVFFFTIFYFNKKMVYQQKYLQNSASFFAKFTRDLRISAVNRVCLI